MSMLQKIANATGKSVDEVMKLLNYGSQKAPTLIDDVAEEINPLVRRATTEATEVAPEVIGIKSAPVSTMDATFDVFKKNPFLTSTGVAAGGAGLISALSGGGDETPVMLKEPQAKSKITPVSEAIAPTPEAPATLKKEAPEKAPESAMSEDATASTPEKREGPDFVKMMLDAQALEKDGLFDAKLLRGSEMLGAGLARVSPEYGSSDIARKEAALHGDRAKAVIGATKEQQSFDKARDELNDEDKLRDLDSEVSKLTSQLAVKAGLIKPGTKMSAMALKSSGVNLGNLLATIESANARRDSALLSRESRLSERQGRIDARKDEEDLKRLDKRKLITEEVEDRRRNLQNNLKEWERIIKETGTGEVFGSENEQLMGLQTDIATDMAKLADPKSAAMSAEVEKYRKVLPKIGAFAPMTNKTATDLLQNIGDKVNQRVEQAYAVRGIKNPDSISALTTESIGKSIVKKQYSPSSNKTKIIYSDGTEEILDGKK